MPINYKHTLHNKNNMDKTFNYFESKKFNVNCITKNIWEISKNDIKFTIYAPFLVIDQDSVISKEISESKSNTNSYLKSKNYPHTNQLFLSSINDLDYSIDHIGFPCAIKPTQENNGRGVYCNINSREELLFFITQSSQYYSNGLILEKHVEGNDYRITIINNEFLFAVQRKPPTLIGDGENTITQLLDEQNKKLLNIKKKINVQELISIDDEFEYILKTKNLTTQSILSKNETLILKSISNMSVGGERIFIPKENINKSVIEMCESLTKNLNLFSLGIDYITEDITKDPVISKDAIIEINYNPQVSDQYYFKSLDRMIERYECK